MPDALCSLFQPGPPVCSSFEGARTLEVRILAISINTEARCDKSAVPKSVSMALLPSTVARSDPISGRYSSLRLLAVEPAGEEFGVVLSGRLRSVSGYVNGVESSCAGAVSLLGAHQQTPVDSNNSAVVAQGQAFGPFLK